MIVIKFLFPKGVDMKKWFLILAMVSVLVFSVSSAETVSFNLQSIVGADLNITTTIPGTKAVDPTTTATSIGTVTISSNLASWTITISSLHDGDMKRVGGTEVYPYLFSFGTVAVDHDLATDLVITKTAPQNATNVTLSISHQTAVTLGLPAGTYEDTITVALAAL